MFALYILSFKQQQGKFWPLLLWTQLQAASKHSCLEEREDTLRSSNAGVAHGTGDFRNVDLPLLDCYPALSAGRKPTWWVRNQGNLAWATTYSLLKHVERPLEFWKASTSTRRLTHLGRNTNHVTHVAFPSPQKKTRHKTKQISTICQIHKWHAI